LAQPLVERFLVEMEILQEGAAEQRGGLREQLRLCGARQRLERRKVDRPGAGRQPDMRLVGGEQLAGVELLAQKHQRLAQALPRLRVGAAAPQQRRELLAAGGLLRTGREVSEQRAAFAGDQPDRQAAFSGERKPAEQAQAHTGRQSHCRTPVSPAEGPPVTAASYSATAS